MNSPPAARNTRLNLWLNMNSKACLRRVIPGRAKIGDATSFTVKSLPIVPVL
jgi:hypothetical protein